MSSVTFVNGYLGVMAGETEQVKASMLLHLQELMEDADTYGWEAVRIYHAAWLQFLEQGCVSCGDEDKKLKLYRALVWQTSEVGIWTLL